MAGQAEDSKELSGANGSEAAPAAEAPKTEAEVAKPIEAKATDAANNAEAKDAVANEVEAKVAEAPVSKGPAKGPGKGPAKGPPKGKGKSAPPVEEAAPAAEAPKTEAEVAEPIEAKSTDAASSAEAKDAVANEVEAKVAEAAPAAEVPKAEAEVGEPIEAKATDAGNSAEAKDVKEVKFLLPAKGNLPEAPMAPADHLYGASVDLKNAYANGRLLKRGPIYGYMFQPRWCVLTNSQLIIYKDEHLSQRQSAERFTEQMTATRFSCHDAPGEAVKHKSEKPYGFVFDSVPLAGKARKLSYFDAENEEMLTQWLQAFKQAALRRKEAVTLHFYDMVMGSTQGEGSVQPLGTGNFHVGIEINGFEWSYGFSELGTGVFSSKPTHCVPHSYRDAVELGYSTLNESEIEEHISKLKDQWPGSSYDLLKNNCSNFCHTLCEALGVSIPPWILRLSSAEVLGQNLPAEKGRRGRGSAIIIAAQALDQ